MLSTEVCIPYFVFWQNLSDVFNIFCILKLNTQMIKNRVDTSFDQSHCDTEYIHM